MKVKPRKKTVGWLDLNVGDVIDDSCQYKDEFGDWHPFIVHYHGKKYNKFMLPGRRLVKGAIGFRKKSIGPCDEKNPYCVSNDDWIAKRCCGETLTGTHKGCGWLCTKPKGHTGPHVACNTPGHWPHLAFTWRNGDEKPTLNENKTEKEKG